MKYINEHLRNSRPAGGGGEGAFIQGGTGRARALTLPSLRSRLLKPHPCMINESVAGLAPLAGQRRGRGRERATLSDTAPPMASAIRRVATTSAALLGAARRPVHRLHHSGNCGRALQTLRPLTSCAFTQMFSLSRPQARVRHRLKRREHDAERRHADGQRRGDARARQVGQRAAGPKGERRAV